MQRFPVTLLAAAFALLALGVCAADAQPPVARPQPPPPVPNAPASAKPADAKPAPAPQQPGAKPQTAPAATTTPGAKPKAAPPATAAPAAADLPPAACKRGAPVLAGAQYLAWYEAGMGQAYCLYGSTLAFADVVAYYRSVLKDRGELVFDAPATHMFEVGKFKETDVDFPPGVTVKDYTWGGSPGYANPKPGATPAFFPTVIQIVPPPLAESGDRE